MKALIKGGINLGAMAKIAWSALKTAIPGILIQLLIEKLVSMIVPAAGAVLAVIEGLQAAWRTVSKIIGAIDKISGPKKKKKATAISAVTKQGIRGVAVLEGGAKLGEEDRAALEARQDPGLAWVRGRAPGSPMAA